MNSKNETEPETTVFPLLSAWNRVRQQLSLTFMQNSDSTLICMGVFYLQKNFSVVSNNRKSDEEKEIWRCLKDV